MVGGRRRALDTTTSYSNGNGSRKKSVTGREHNDLEAAYASIKKAKPRKRFRDAIQDTIRDSRTAEMKKQLIDNVDHEILEKYRKSEESVREALRSVSNLVTNGNMTAQDNQ